jgi:hypothetical protein
MLAFINIKDFNLLTLGALPDLNKKANDGFSEALARSALALSSIDEGKGRLTRKC